MTRRIHALATIAIVLATGMSNQNQPQPSQPRGGNEPAAPSATEQRPAPTGNPPVFPANRIIREGGTPTLKP